jgi:hypothetical protein
MTDQLEQQLRQKISDLEKELYRYTHGERAWRKRYCSTDQFTEEQYDNAIISPIELTSRVNESNRTITIEQLKKGLV